jgi:hypothetical protein
MVRAKECIGEIGSGHRFVDSVVKLRTSLELIKKLICFGRNHPAQGG